MFRRNVAIWILGSFLLVPVCVRTAGPGSHSSTDQHDPQKHGDPTGGLSALNPSSGNTGNTGTVSMPGAHPAPPPSMPGAHLTSPPHIPSTHPEPPPSMPGAHLTSPPHIPGAHPAPSGAVGGVEHAPTPGVHNTSMHHNGSSSVPAPTPSHSPVQDLSTPTHEVSGLDVDFKGQEQIDHTVDTMNAKSGGNWLLKRVWWEKTEDVYEQIKEVFNKVMDTRMQFISDYNKLNRTLDIFYSEIGIEQGPLRDLLSHAQDLMEKEEKEQGFLNKKEQAFVFKIKGKERDLEQLKLDVKAIQELDNKLDEAFEVLFKQIDVCNQYEQKAWNNFKEIARELNDKEARKLYYDTEGLHKDVQKVSQYISGAFSTYFNQTIQSAHDHTAKISSQMNALKHDGVDLVKEAEILEKEEEPAPKKVVIVKPKPEKKSWWYSLGDKLGKFISSIISLIPVSIQKWLGKEVKAIETEAEKLEREGKQEYEHLKKEAEVEYQSSKKYVQQDIAYAKKEAHSIKKSAFDELTESERKELGIAAPSVHHAPTHNAVHPVQHSATVATAPHVPIAPKVPKAPVHHAAPKINPTLAPTQHKPLHIQHPPQQPRRSITDHFQSPHQVTSPHGHQATPMSSNVKPLHVDGAKLQGPLK